jgi:2-iminobutanoate/2-iminopropanoate deaminase
MTVSAYATATLMLLATAHGALAQNGRKNIVLGRSPAEQATTPWSDAVLVGNTLYLSGYVGADPKTLVVPASAEEETRLAMDDIQHTMEAAGMTMDDLVVVHVLCTDLSLFKQFNKAYATYFHGGFPARTFTGASTLLLGAHFEITGVAVKRGK